MHLTACDLVRSERALTANPVVSHHHHHHECTAALVIHAGESATTQRGWKLMSGVRGQIELLKKPKKKICDNHCLEFSCVYVNKQSVSNKVDTFLSQEFFFFL